MKSPSLNIQEPNTRIVTPIKTNKIYLNADVIPNSFKK